MTKRRSKKKKQGSFQRLLLSIIIVIVLVVLVQQGIIDEETLEEWGILQDTGDNNEVVVEVPPVSGDFYNLYFTAVINSDDESRHRGATVESALISAIDGAQSSIDGALFELNAPDTTAALVRALGRGVQVRLVLDDEHALEDPESTAEEVIAAGAQVRSDNRSALMHNKFLIFDGRAVWTGSMNLTRNGIYNNNNNAMLIQAQAPRAPARGRRLAELTGPKRWIRTVPRRARERARDPGSRARQDVRLAYVAAGGAATRSRVSRPAAAERAP